MPTQPTSQVIDNLPDLIQLVCDCRRDRMPIVDYGQAHRHMGFPPPTAHVALRQQGGVLEHYKDDMTVRVSAGATVGQLNDVLEASHQFCPINADADITLGEVIVHNMYGPLRGRYGAMRDLLMGLHYLDSFGRDIHVGGRTVKNVAGYDLTRLMVGSMGMLGLVHETTLRTYAIPEQVARLDIQVKNPTQLASTITSWMISDANPATTHLRRDTQANRWILETSYLGREQANDVQVAALKEMIHTDPNLTLIDEQRCDLKTQMNHWRTLEQRWRYLQPIDKRGSVHESTQTSPTPPMEKKQRVETERELPGEPGEVKVIVPPAATGQLCRVLVDLGADHVTGLVAHGCLFASGMFDAEMDQALLQQLKLTGGMRLWIRRPEAGKHFPPFAPPGPDWSLIHRLKHTMDPDNLFNPGRFTPGKSENPVSSDTP